MGVIWDSVTGGFVALDNLLLFSLDTCPWESFLFARNRQGYPSVWDLVLNPICNFRSVSSTHVSIDVSREWFADYDPLRVESAPLTGEADGHGKYEIEQHSLSLLTESMWEEFSYDGWDGDITPGGLFDCPWSVILRILPPTTASIASCEVTL